MTVSTELSHEEYTGNGVTTDFDFRFRIFEAKHLVVSVADPDGTERILTNGTDYTLRGVGSYRGGKVILKMPLATGWKIGIARDLPAVQETDLRNQGKFFAEVHEDAFDYLTMLIQKSLGFLSLCLRKPSFISDHYDAKGNKISNLGKPVKDGDAVDLGTMKEHISAKDKRSLRVVDKDIPALPNAANRANKLLSFDNDGNPVVIVPESGSAADVLTELGKPDGGWLTGKASTLQALLSYPVKVGYIYETEGYYSVGDKGAAKYLISDTKGDIPELAYECENGLYAILQHNGTITLEQLGAKGVALGQTATEDSWPAFYKAYQIKRAHVWNLSVEFVAGNSAYFCSKPVLMTTGMTLRTPNTSWICKIIYGGGKVTKSEVPDIKGTDKDDGIIFYSDIKAQVIFVHAEGFSCYYSSIDGFQFRNSSGADPVDMYGVYAPYLAKVNIHNCRFNEVNYGIRWINYWNGSLKQTLFSGITTGTTAPVNSVGVWSEPYNGIDSYTSCGTSLTFECVGVSWFQSGYKICNLVYSNFNGCYSEMAVDRAIEFIGCAGITVSTFGLENLKNTLYSTIRFNNAQVTMNNLVFAYNNEFAGGNVVFVTNRSKVNMAGCSFGRLKNTGTAGVLFNISSDAELSIDGTVDIPASIISSPGYSFATVGGKLYSDHLFSKTMGVANGGSASNAVTFTMNDFSYKFKGGTVWFNYAASWTGGSGTDMQIYGFPKAFTKDTSFSAISPMTGKSLYARSLLGTDRVRIQNATDASYVSIPSSGGIYIQGEYQA